VRSSSAARHSDAGRYSQLDAVQTHYAVGVDFRVIIEPQQGATYADQLVRAKAAERLGFSALFPI